jgi:hypothetical protein
MVMSIKRREFNAFAAATWRLARRVSRAPRERRPMLPISHFPRWAWVA